MVETLSRASLQRLLETSDEHCISIYLPTHRAGREVRQDSIRLKNLVNGAEDELREAGITGTRLQKILQPAHDVLDDTLFWQHQGHGLALFLSESMSLVLKLPFEPEEFLLVASRFYLTPLLPLLNNDGRFYILAVSQKQPRFYEATRDRIERIELDDLPGDMESALANDQPNPIQRRPQMPRAAGRRASDAVFAHAHTDAGKKEDIQEYLKIVASAVDKYLAGKNDPLVFAAVDYVFPMYQQASQYRHLHDVPVVGGVDLKSDDQLHREAWELVAPHFRDDVDRSLEAFHVQFNAGAASWDVEDVLAAAHIGRVATLLVASDAHLWGRYSEQDGLSTEGDDAGKDDLLDLAVQLVLKQGGSVFVLDPAKVPGGGPLAAIYRYALTPSGENVIASGEPGER